MTAPTHLLVVCTANVCRSPVGEALLRRVVADVGHDDTIVVSSAGVRAMTGAPAVKPSRQTAGRWGIDLSEHRARPLSRDVVDAASLVLTMEDAHRDAVVAIAPAALPRTFTWLEFARLAPAVAPPSRRVRRTVADVASSAHARRAFSVAVGPEDVADPVGRSARHHRRMAATLVESAARFLPALLTGSGSPVPLDD